MENIQSNSDKIVQLFYYDDATGSWVPVGANTPMPVNATFSGTITIGSVDQGSPNTMLNAWPVKITDGTDVLGTLANPLHVISDSTTSGTVTVVQSVGSNLHVVLDSSALVQIGNVVHVLPDTSNVVIQGIVNSLNTFAPGTMDVFGGLVAGQRNNQVEVSFVSWPIEDLIVSSTAGTGTITLPGGHALFSTGTDATAEAKGVSFGRTFYKPGHEVYALFTANFTTPTDTSSFQRIGHYDTSNGFFIGYEGLTFGITKRSGAIDVSIAQVNFNTDILDGSVGSKFTRNGTPEALDITKLNVFRIRFGWLGSAPIYFEVLNPDGAWVIFHKILQPNLANAPSIQDPNNPITIDVSKSGSDATDLVVATSCWAAGVVSDLNGVDTIITKQINAVAQEVVLLIQPGVSTAAAQITGTWSGVINFEVSIDGVNFVTQTVGNEANGTTVVQALGNGIYTAPVGGFQQFRLRAVAWYSGTAFITIRSTTGTHAVMLIESLPSGTNHIGEVGIVPPPDFGFLGSFTGISQVFGPTPIISGYSTGIIQVSGTWSGEILVETTVDVINFVTQNLVTSSLLVSSITANGVYTFATTGSLFVRLSTTSWASGQADFLVENSTTIGNVIVQTPVTVVQPTGSNLHVVLDTSAVVGAFADNSVNSQSKLPVLPSVANANYTSWSEGNQVPLSVDTSGNLRIVSEPSEVGGVKAFHLVSAASTNATNIKSAPGQVYGWDINNSINGYRKVCFHNTASTPTAGSNIFFTIGLDSSAASRVDKNIGIEFTAGIGITTVTGHSDVDSSAVGAQNLDINIFYI